MRKARTILVVLALLAVTPAAWATPLPPGATVTPNTATFDDTSLLATNTTNITGPGFTGTFTQTVRRISDTSTMMPGGLLFSYQVTNASGSTANINNLITRSFANFTLDVSSTDFAGFLSASRTTGTGETVTFANIGQGPVSPGETSVMLVIRTDAQAFDFSGTTTLGGSQGNSGPFTSFAPVAIVPEPTSLALMAIGVPLAAAGCYRRWRAKRQPA